MVDDKGAFEREEVTSQPGIIGASWWQASLDELGASLTRRRAIGLALGAGGAVVGFGALIALIAHGCSEQDEPEVLRKKSLEMQVTYGWNFGAPQESVTFDGVSTLPFDRSALTRLASDLRPRSARYTGFYTPTLFESPSARPLSSFVDEPETIVPLDQVLMPIFTPSMRRAYRQGEALASLVAEQSLSTALVIVDLDGPESVAFAAGASEALEPIFTFGNWPHPRGVVKAHRTLSAAAYFQPLFAKAQQRGARPALVVLDRQRSSPYRDDATQFDNRYLPLVPTPAALWQWGVSHVLYVTQGPVDRESPDLNQTFLAYQATDIEVKLVSADAFAPQSGVPQEVDNGSLLVPTNTRVRYFYGGNPSTHNYFWHDYPWSKKPTAAAVEPNTSRPGRSYHAVADGPSVHPQSLAGTALGTVAMAVSRQSGRIMGPLLNRNGSWNRSDGSYGGG